MKIKLLIIPFAMAALASCSTAYKSGQTPDDVYYSPARPEVVTQRTEVRNDDDYAYMDYEYRNIHMGVRDYRWRYLDDMYDYNYQYNPYAYGYNYGYYYNPYYYNYPVYIGGYNVVNPKYYPPRNYNLSSYINTTPRTTNLGGYTNNNTTVGNGKGGQTQWIQTRPAYNNSNSGSSRRVIRPEYNNTNTRRESSTNTRSTNTESNNTRTYSPSTPSSSSGSSSSGSSSSGTSVSRPGRGE